MVIRFASRRDAATGRLVGAVPAADGLMEAWALGPEGALTSYGAVELSAVIRSEHMQPRYCGDDDVTVGPALWRFPEGALRGRPRSLPFPLDAVDGEESDADAAEGGVAGSGDGGGADSDDGASSDGE